VNTSSRNLPAGTYLADVRQGGRSALDSAISVSATNREPIEVVVRKDGARVSGTLLSSRRGLGFSTVVLVPETPRRTAFAHYKTAMTNYRGQFQFADVPPGEYKLFSWANVPDGAWTNADYLSKFDDRGTAVKVNADQTVLDLQVNLIH
jgi:hypothetical protein